MCEKTWFLIIIGIGLLGASTISTAQAINVALDGLAAGLSPVQKIEMAQQCPFRYCYRKCAKNQEGDVVCHCYCRYKDEDGTTKTRRLW
jgi:hypothetical protein